MGYFWDQIFLLSLGLGLMLGAHAQSSYYRRSYYNPMLTQTARFYHPSGPPPSYSYSTDLLPEASKRKEYTKPPYSKVKIPFRPFTSEEDDFSNERLSSAEYSNESHGYTSKENDSREYTIGTQIRVQHPITVPKKPTSIHGPHPKQVKYTSAIPYKTTSYGDVHHEELSETKSLPKKHSQKYTQLYEPASSYQASSYGDVHHEELSESKFLPKKHSQKYTQLYEPANSYQTTSYGDVHHEELSESKLLPKKHSQKYTQLYEPANSYKISSFGDVNLSAELPDVKPAPKKHAQKYTQIFEPDPFRVVAPPKSTAPSALGSSGYNVYEPEEEEYEVAPPANRLKASLRDRYKGVASKKQVEKYLEDQQKMLDDVLKLQLLNNPKFQHLLKTKEHEHFEEQEYEHEFAPPLPPFRSNFNEHPTFKPNRSRRRPKVVELQRSPKVKSAIVARPKRKFRSAIVINV